MLTRRFYLTGDLTNLFYPFIQGSLEWPFSEVFSANLSLWNQCKYIAFNIFSCRILTVSYKMLIITGLNVTIFSRQKLTSLFQVQQKLKTWMNSKLNFLSDFFILNHSHTKVVWLHIVFFGKHDILHFWDNVHLLKYYPVKVLQNCSISFSCSNQDFKFFLH